MATSDDDQQQQPQRQLTFYPAYCFNASPTHFTWVKMAAVDVHRLKRRSEFGDQGLFFYLNHPIRFVSLVGLILARTDVPRRTILTLDDSSGATIDIAVLKSDPSTTTIITTADGDKDIATSPSAQQPSPNKSSAQPKETHLSTTSQTPLDISILRPGTIVQVKGTLSTFRQTMQVQLERFFPVRETNAEMRFVEQRMRFLVEVLAVPWWLSPGEIQQLRDRADEEGSKVEEEQERMRRRRVKKSEKEERDRRRILRMWEREEVVRKREAEVCREDGVRLMRGFKRRRVE